MRNRVRSLRDHRRQRGQTMLIFILMLTTLIGFLGLVMDGGQGFHSRRQLQNAADAAALAGTYVLLQNRFASNYPAAFQVAATKAAQKAAEANSAPDPDRTPNDGVNSAVTITPVDVYGVPTATGWSDARVRGLKVDVAARYDTLFIRVVGITTIDVKTTATGAWGYTSNILGMLPMAVNRDSVPSSYTDGQEYRANLSPAGGGAGNVNYGTFTVTGQTLSDAWLNGLKTLVQLNKPYPANDIQTISQVTCDALNARINAVGHTSETWRSFSIDSPRVAVMAVLNGDVGGATVVPIGFVTVFIDAVSCSQQMVTLHFIRAPILPNGTQIDPTIVNPPAYTPAVMKLID
ncbi:MAG: pilus assembly protein TadG-related protein [Candidatus Dormibacteraeota bacterium]|nr:pilus assembly protein TadG-related protein [Candidatus Dormibacteraeota bacterium]